MPADFSSPNGIYLLDGQESAAIRLIFNGWMKTAGIFYDIFNSCIFGLKNKEEFCGYIMGMPPTHSALRDRTGD